MQRHYYIHRPNYNGITPGCLGGAAVRGRTRDRKVAGSTPGMGAIESTRSTQPSIPLGYVNRVPACMAGVRRDAFTCIG